MPLSNAATTLIVTHLATKVYTLLSCLNYTLICVITQVVSLEYFSKSKRLMIDKSTLLSPWGYAGECYVGLEGVHRSRDQNALLPPATDYVAICEG